MRVRTRLRSGRIMVVGHRGAAALAPENTLAAIAAAFDEGADAVEVDVRVTSDGNCVLAHDATTLRTAGVDLEISATPWATLRDAATGDAGIPLLEEAFDAAGDRGLWLLEIKEAYDHRPHAVALALATARRAGVLDRVAVLAFDHRHLLAARVAEPGCARVALVETLPDDVDAVVGAVGADALAPPWPLVDAGVVGAARAAGAEVVAWTVDDVDAAVALGRLGVAALIGNDPGGLVRVLEGEGLRLRR